MQRVLANIHSEALTYNLSLLKKNMPDKRILAMVKANGYGHGLVMVAKALENADAFGVATLEEAITLRKANITHPIVLMAGFINLEELREVFEWKLDTVVHHPEQVKLLLQMQERDSVDPLRIWLKMETGMHRLGLSPEAFLSAYSLLKNCNIVHDIIALMHFAQTDESGRMLSDQQVHRFRSVIQGLSVETCVANSMAILSSMEKNSPFKNFLSENTSKFTRSTDWIRPGMMLYGVSPFANSTGSDFGLMPALELESRLISVKNIQPGAAVGYGSAWTCDEPTRIGIVSVGYGDGYPRSLPNGTPTLVKNAICPLIGRVSMDMLAIDLRAVPHAELGDRVILWGKELPVETIASYANLSPYELITHLNQRVLRGNRK